jgi:hypothetical protein
MTSLWLALALLVILGGSGVRRLLRARTGRQPFLIDDDQIRQIEETGMLETGTDEPLDQDRIDEAERRFWRESSWDEPEEY